MIIPPPAAPYIKSISKAPAKVPAPAGKSAGARRQKCRRPPANVPAPAGKSAGGSLHKTHGSSHKTHGNTHKREQFVCVAVSFVYFAASLCVLP